MVIGHMVPIGWLIVGVGWWLRVIEVPILCISTISILIFIPIPRLVPVIPFLLAIGVSFILRVTLMCYMPQFSAFMTLHLITLTITPSMVVWALPTPIHMLRSAIVGVIVVVVSVVAIGSLTEVSLGVLVVLVPMMFLFKPLNLAV